MKKKPKQRGPITAAESTAILAKDPEYQKMMRQREAKMAALDAELTKDEKPLIDDLRKAGIEVESVFDLVNTKLSFPSAIPVLMKHLKMNHHPRIRDGIVRALIDPASVIVFKEVYEEFCNTPALSQEEDPSHFKWLLGAVLAEASRVETLPLIVDLLRDKRHGEGRERLICALKRLPKKKRDIILRDLNKDPELSEIIKKEKLKFSPEE